VVASIASFSRFSLMPGAMMMRAVPPTAGAPLPQDRPQPLPAHHSAAIVTLAPAAMSALLQAQESQSKGASRPARARTLTKFDRRASGLADESADEGEADEGLFAERWMQRRSPRG
jgi:hypothetical protein